MREEILLMAKDLPIGATKAGEYCPFCRGGRTGERSFSITRRCGGDLIFYCHRASCQRTGTIDDYTNISIYPTKVRVSNYFDLETKSLSEIQLKYFQTVYGLQPDEVGFAEFLYVPDLRAVWQPVFGPKGEKRGGVVRSYQKKEVKSHPELEGCPWLAWYPEKRQGTDGVDHRGDSTRPKGLSHPCNALVIVEDQLSALKCSRFHDCVALLGGSLGPEKVAEIASQCVSRASVLLLLDSDAYSTALKHWKRWKQILPGIQAEKLDGKDPKYWSDEQIKIIGE